MGVLPTMRSDKSEILPYNFKDYYAFIGLEKLSDHPSFRMFNHWLRSVYEELHADHETGAADNK